MTDNRPNTAFTLEKRLTRQAFYHLDTCTRCSACTERCHMYYETEEPIHSPAYKLALLRRVHRRYYTLAGKLAPKFFKAMELNDKNLKELSGAMFECTMCRRCTVHCPFGIDPPWPVSAGRFLCKTVGTAPEMLTMIAQVGVEKAKNISQYEDLYLEQIRTLETQLRTETQDPEARIPVKNRSADMLYVPIAGAHTIMPVAKIFNSTKDSWSLSLFDAANYSYFLGDIEAAKVLTGQIIREAETLNVKSIVMTECGHGYRVMKQFASKWFNRTFPFQIKSIVEVMAMYIHDGRVKLDPSANPRVVTYHDPCQLGRNGGIFEEPRTVLRAAVKEFRELAPPSRQYNWCCGAGGGVVAVPDFKELRMKTGRRKAEQIRETKPDAVASACENCRSQLNDLNEHYNLGVKVTSVMDLMANALKH
jgi:Fe-S oxidoreductase